MALLTLATLAVMPLTVPLLISGLEVAPWDIARPLLLFIMLPLVAAMIARAASPAWAASAAPLMQRTGSISLVLVLAVLLLFNLPALSHVIGRLAFAAAGLHVLGLFAAGWFLCLPWRELRSVLSLGSAARNFAAALAPVAAFRSDPDVMIMLVVGALASLILLFPAALFVRRRAHAPTPANERTENQ
jgi:BASS family bile acid:Na+ symporter